MGVSNALTPPLRDGPACQAAALRYSSAASLGASPGQFIEVVGARQNNLAGTNLKLQRRI
jgi:hypothetical protein